MYCRGTGLHAVGQPTSKGSTGSLLIPAFLRPTSLPDSSMECHIYTEIGKFVIYHHTITPMNRVDQHSLLTLAEREAFVLNWSNGVLPFITKTKRLHCSFMQH